MNDKEIHFVVSPRGYGKCYKEYKEVIDYFENKINKLQQENQQLKKQKDDVTQYIKNTYNNITKLGKRDLLRMLGEIK